MICKKCGANIADTAKFCGYCGNPIEQPQPVVDIQSTQNNTQVEQVTEQGSNTNLNNVEFNNSVDVQSIEQPVMNQVEQPIIENTTQGSSDNNSKKTKGNANKLIPIIVGIVLILIALVLLFIAFNKSSNNSIAVLEKAINNFEEKGKNSGTINANLLIESGTSDTINLSATAKYSKTNDIYNLALILNESILYDEMSIYSTISEKDITLYAKSSLIDMLGLTSSAEDMWLYYFIDLTEFADDNLESNNDDFDLSDIIDEKHFKYINKVDNLRHYELVIDDDLINKIESKATEEERQEIEDSLSSISNGEMNLTETYIIDFYIDDSNQLVKISMDLSDYMEDDEISKVILSFEFMNLNSTTVEIPQDALSSQNDLETYISTYSSYDSSVDYDDNYIDDLDMTLENY